jgi:cytochrome c oxidase subunit III
MLDTKFTPDEYRIHPHKFMMWVAMISMTMFFAAITSYLLVKKGDAQNWVSFAIPQAFLYSTICIALSSATIHFAQSMYNAMNKNMYKLGMLITLILSILFAHFQIEGWKRLTDIGMPLNGHPSGSIVHVITYLHGAHYIFAIFFLILIYLLTFFKKADKEAWKLNIPYTDRVLHFELLTSFWHYIGIVWIYLYLMMKYVVYN